MKWESKQPRNSKHYLLLGQQQTYIWSVSTFKKNDMKEGGVVFYKNNIFDFDGEKFNDMREACKYK